MDYEISIDFETYSEAELKKTGAFRYAEDPSTEVLCLAVSEGSRVPELWYPGLPIPDPIKRLQDHQAPQVWAWNATFEAAIWAYKFKDVAGFEIPHHWWRDSAALSAYFGYPLDLDRASSVLGDEPKDKRGKQLITLLCKPCKPTKKFPHSRRTKETHPDEFDELYDYCLQDVRAEMAVRQALPRQHLPENEQKYWYINLLSAFRGVKVDVPLVKALRCLRDETNKALEKECRDITGGVAPTQVKVIREYLEEEHGVELPNLQAETVDKLLASGDLEPVPHRILEIRRAIGKVAVKKVDSMMLCKSPSDDRLRGMLVYYGAGTGRFAGRLVQLHNLARGHFRVRDDHIHLALNSTVEDITYIYEDIHDFISTLIRPCLIADDGYYFYDADYSAIEGRGTAWLAGQESMLRQFRDGLDVYKVMATLIFGVKYDRVDWFQRFVGKQAILGLGYQMGVDRFMGTCEGYGQPIDRDLAERTVNTYREANYKIRQLWYNTFDAFCAAIENVNTVIRIQSVCVAFNGRYLFVKLPSGRTLTYVQPRIVTVEKSWGPTKQIQYMGIDSKTKRWTKIDLYGGKIVENLVQAIARDVMCENILRLEKSGFEFLLSIHDQIMCRHKSPDRLDEYLSIMSTVPDWAHGYPIKSEGKVCQRFSK